ncbi:MAG: UDP-2-acetamido-3-amino-2,3-dideoxy-D-glucuronate N-acetyltransferase [Chlamydiae bacterium]|nr:UDP-2-acetamido-3-amino-2,3-dideoxy-D-glucuronate N-acetyltransferase [Chlamydiota bacterium]
MSEKRTLALVGAGCWGKNLARNFYEIGVLHTICDTNEALLDTYQEKYPEVNVTSNFSHMLENDDIQQIAIAAPAFQHYQLAKQVLLAGKDVFVEKPLCLDSAEAKELIHIADEQGCILMVGHILHFHPCVRKLQELVAQGDLGKIQYITSNRLNLGSYRTEENALWNFAPHDISVILSLCGHQLPEKVRCTGAAYLSEGVADKTLTTLKFPGDIQAHIYVSWLNPFKEQKLTIVGSHGLAVFDDMKPWGEKLLLYRNHVSWDEGNRPVATNPESESMDPPQQEPLKEECLHFLKCCHDRTTPLTDGDEGLKVLQVLQAAQDSLEADGKSMNPAIHHISLDRKSFQIHPTAIVDKGAQIGPETMIWHFSHISSGAKIGKKCRIGQNVYIAANACLGSNVKVQNNVSVYSGVVCEDDVFLGPSMVFTNIMNPRSEVVRRDQYVQTLIKRGATIGANATILCGIELGTYCFVGAGATVTKDVKPFALMIGCPAEQKGWISRHGEKLDLPLQIDEDEEVLTECPETGEIYSLKGDQVNLVEAEEGSPSQHEFVKVK